ncbi:MAG TPA: hypothetical protein VGA70_02675 [Longimicrobiales bacterium]
MSSIVNLLIPLTFLVPLAGGVGFVIYHLAAGELGGFWPYLLIAGALVLALPFVVLLKAGFHRTNWLLRIRDDGLVLKFRSDLNAELPEPHPVVVNVPYRSIRSMRHTRERVRHHSLSEEGADRVLVSFLDFRLAAGVVTEPLRRAIAAELAFSPEGSHTLHRHYPVRLDGDVLRVQWRTGLRPGLKATVARLRPHVSEEERLTLTRDFTAPVTAERADDDILELARRGRVMAAIALARRFYGVSLTEAKLLVDRLLAGERDG